jgi:hypothetical protein
MFTESSYKQNMRFNFKLPLISICFFWVVGTVGLLCSTLVSAQNLVQTSLVQTSVGSSNRSPIVLEFNSFFKMPIGPKGLEVTDKVKQASGQNVVLTGYMVQSEVPTLGAFMLSPRPVQMSEHADGDANDLPASVCWVYLDDSQKNWVVPHATGLISVTGQFNFKRIETADGMVAWFHLQLGQDAVRAVDPVAHSHHHH